MRSGSLDDRAALAAESERRRSAKHERAERIRAHAANNPDMSLADIARAFGVGRWIVESALGRRAH